MDNVTHVFAGLLVAEAAVIAATARGAQPNAAFRRRAWFVSALSNNLPDFDFLYLGITGGKIGYLLHHRGHTHTFVFALLFGVLTFLLSVAWERRQARRPGATSADPQTLKRERLAILALALAGGFLHIGMDFFNNYGVHPFWPIDEAWFYGDSIFIIEPWFFVFTVPPLVFASRRAWARVLLGLPLVAGLGLAWLLPLAGAGVAATLTLAAGFWFWCCRRMRAEHRALASLVGSLVVLFTFVVAGRSARARLLESPALAKTSRLETVLTPAPSNPLCWSAITVGERDARYELRVAALSLAPSLFAPEACRFQPSGQSLPEGVERFARGGADRGELSGAAAVDTPPGLRWELAWSAPLSELRSLFHTNCQARAFLRYARVPFWFSQAPAEVYLGDLRYDRAPEPEFTELSVPANPVTCPRFVPPWRPPRHDLLDAR